MALFYLFGALTVVCVHWAAVPAAFAAIFRGAFGLQAAGGGVLGYGMARAISWGFKRGAFSNEAGLGASVLVHCAANVEEPVQQGMWGMFEVFADTMVVCTLTALVVLTSGLVDLDTGAALTDVEGSALVGQAFSTVFGAFGPQFIAVSVLLFAYSTTLGWSHYGTRAVVYLLGERAAAGYKLVFAAMVLVGAVMKLDLAWALSDTFNGLMMLPNLVGVGGAFGGGGPGDTSVSETKMTFSVPAVCLSDAGGRGSFFIASFYLASGQAASGSAPRHARRRCRCQRPSAG